MHIQLSMINNVSGHRLRNSKYAQDKYIFRTQVDISGCSRVTQFQSSPQCCLILRGFFHSGYRVRWRPKRNRVCHLNCNQRLMCNQGSISLLRKYYLICFCKTELIKNSTFFRIFILINFSLYSH